MISASSDLRPLLRWVASNRSLLAGCARLLVPLPGLAIYWVIFSQMMSEVSTFAEFAEELREVLTHPGLLLYLVVSSMTVFGPLWRAFDRRPLWRWVSIPVRGLLFFAIAWLSSWVVWVVVLGFEVYDTQRLRDWSLVDGALTRDASQPQDDFMLVSVLLVFALGIWRWWRRSWKQAAAEAGWFFLVVMMLFAWLCAPEGYTFFVHRRPGVAATAYEAWSMVALMLAFFGAALWLVSHSERPTQLPEASPLRPAGGSTRSYINSARLLSVSVLIVVVLSMQLALAQSRDWSSLNRARQTYAAWLAHESLNEIGVETRLLAQLPWEGRPAKGFGMGGFHSQWEARRGYSGLFPEERTFLSDLTGLDSDWPEADRTDALRLANDPAWQAIASPSGERLTGTAGNRVEVTWATGRTDERIKTIYGLRVSALAKDGSDAVWRHRPLFRVEDRGQIGSDRERLDPIEARGWITRENSPEADFGAWLAWASGRDFEEELREIAVVARVDPRGDTVTRQYEELELALLDRDVPVPMLANYPLPPIPAATAFATGALLLLTLIRSRIRASLERGKHDSSEPWLILDGGKGAERVIAGLWTLGILLAPWITAGAMNYVFTLNLVTLDVDLDLVRRALLRWISLVTMLAGGWIGLTAVSLLIRLREDRASALEAAAEGAEAA